jgi:glycosyltransferase involved in cell wall biosynthesis
MRILLRELLSSGHEVHFFGLPGFSEAPSLTAFPQYRYSPLHIESLERGWGPLQRIPSEIPRAAYAQLAALAYQRAAIQRIEAVSREQPFDLILCSDFLALWPSRLPVVSWPQSAPQTEWAALRSPDIARRVRQGAGRTRQAALGAFYAFRWMQAQVAWRASDLILCGSRWSESAWRSFGVPGARVRRLPYPLDLSAFGEVPARPKGSEIRYLWLGRAAPRKRFDLFLEAFELVSRELHDARAIVVGDLSPDPLASNALATSPVRSNIEQRSAVPRAEMPALFAKVDVLVQPSENENFGFSVAEALASGRPVVVGPTNGTADYADGARFGFDRYTPAAVAMAMTRAAAAVRADAAAISDRARAAARALEPDRITREFVALCEGLCHGATRRDGTR